MPCLLFLSLTLTIGAMHISAASETHTWDLAQKYAGDADDLSPAFAQAIADAKAQLKQSPTDTIRLQIPAGTWHISDTINLDEVVPDDGGQLVIAGAGMAKTTVILKSSGESRYKNLISMMSCERITIEDIYFRREKLHTSQGLVEEVQGKTIIMKTLPGFTNPADFPDELHKSPPWLRKYTYTDKAAPYPDPTLSRQIPCSKVEKIDDTRVAFTVRGDWYQGLKPGDLLGVKIKLRGYLVNGNASYSTFRNLRYTHDSLDGIVLWQFKDPTRGDDMGNNLFENIVINRPDDLIGEWGPCLSQPGDGFRVYGHDTHWRDCTVIATGDDNIALDGGTRQSVINCIAEDGFARGIIAHGSHGDVGDVTIENCVSRRHGYAAITVHDGRFGGDTSPAAASTVIIRNNLPTCPAAAPRLKLPKAPVRQR